MAGVKEKSGESSTLPSETDISRMYVNAMKNVSWQLENGELTYHDAEELIEKYKGEYDEHLKFCGVTDGHEVNKIYYDFIRPREKRRRTWFDSANGQG